MQKSHLLVVRWGEYILLLSISGELVWENFLLNVCVWSYLGNLQSNTLVHHFRIQVFPFNLLAVHVSREQLDRVWIWETC